MGNCYSKIIPVGPTAGIKSITVALAVLQAFIMSLQSYVHTPPGLLVAIGSSVMKLPVREGKRKLGNQVRETLKKNKLRS